MKKKGKGWWGDSPRHKAARNKADVSKKRIKRFFDYMGVDNLDDVGKYPLGKKRTGRAKYYFGDEKK